MKGSGKSLASIVLQKYLLLSYILCEDVVIGRFVSQALQIFSCFCNVSVLFTLGSDKTGYLYENLQAHISVIQPLYWIRKTQISFLLLALLTIALIICVSLTALVLLTYHKTINDSKNHYQNVYFPSLGLIRLSLQVWGLLFFTPLCQIYIMSFHCIAIKDKPRENEEPLGSNLCEGISPGSFSICLIGFICFWIMTLLSVVQQNFTFSNVNFLSRSATYFDIFYISYKALMVLGQFISLLNDNSFLIFGFTFLLQLCLITWVWTRGVYYFPSVERLFFKSLALELWISCFFLLLYFYRKLTISIMSGPSFLVSVLLVLKLASNLINSRFNYLLSFCGISTPDEKVHIINKRIRLLYAFIISQSVIDGKTQTIEYDVDLMSLFVRGVLTLHLDKCKSPSCFCQIHRKRIYDYNLRVEYTIKGEKPSHNIQNLVYLKYFVKSEFQNARERSPEAFSRSPDLRIAYCQFMFYQLRNFHVALVEIFDIQKRFGESMGIMTQLQMYRLLLDIDKLLYNLNRNAEKDPTLSNLNLKLLIRTDENCKLLEQKINQLIREYQSFYEYLMGTLIHVVNLSTRSNRLLKLRSDIDNLYEENNSNPKSLRLYVDYLSNIIFHDEKAYRLEKQLKEKHEILNALKAENRLSDDVQMIYNERTLLIEMSGESRTFGRILKINQNACKYLRYAEHELLLTNVNILMPFRHRPYHDEFLQDYFSTGKGNVMFMERKLFARRKKGYIFQLQLLMKPFFEIQKNEFRFYGNLQPLGSSNELIITDITGAIDAVSERLGRMLVLNPSDFESKNLFLQYLCPRLVGFFSELMKYELKNIDLIENIDELYDGPRNYNQDMVLKVYRTDEKSLIEVREQVEMMIEHSLRGIFNSNRFTFLKKKYIKLAMLGNSYTLVSSATRFVSTNGRLKYVIFLVKEIERPKRSKQLRVRTAEEQEGSENSLESPLVDADNPYNNPGNNQGNNQSNYFQSSTYGYNGTQSYMSHFRQTENFDSLEKEIDYDKSEIDKHEEGGNISDRNRDMALHIHENKEENKADSLEMKSSSPAGLVITEQILTSRANDNIKFTVSLTPSLERVPVPHLDTEMDRVSSQNNDGGYQHMMSLNDQKKETTKARKNLDERADTEVLVSKPETSMNELLLFKKGDAFRRTATSYINEEDNSKLNKPQRKSLLHAADPQALATLAKDWGRLASNVSNMSSTRSPVERKVTMLFSKSPFSGKSNLGFGDATDNMNKDAESSTGTSERRKAKPNEQSPDTDQEKKKKKRKMVKVNIQDETKSSHSTRKGVRFGEDVREDKKVDRKKRGGVHTIAPTEKTNFFTLLKRAVDTQIKIPENVKRDLLIYEQSVRSSVTSVYQQQRGLESSIRSQYLPPCYRQLILSLIFTTLIMICCQIIITIILSGLYSSLSLNLKGNLVYNSLGEALFKICKGMYEVRAIPETLNGTEELNYINQVFMQMEQGRLAMADELKILTNNLDYFRGFLPNFYDYLYNFQTSLEKNFKLTFSRGLLLIMNHVISLAKDPTRTNEDSSVYLIKHEESFDFSLFNVPLFRSGFHEYESFSQNSIDTIKWTKLVLIIVFSLNMVGIVIFSVFRIHRLSLTYKYINYIYELVSNINYDELQIMKTYLASVTTIESTSGKKEGKNKDKELDEVQVNRENERLKKAESKAQGAKRRLKSLISIKFPVTRYLIANVALFLLLLGTNSIVLAVSHIFDREYENLITLEQKIVEGFPYDEFAVNYIYVYDAIRKKETLENYYEISSDDLEQSIVRNLNTEPLNDILEMDSLFAQQYLSLMKDMNLCADLNNRTGTIFSVEEDTERCNSINSGILTKGVLKFRVDYFNRLRSLLVENTYQTPNKNNAWADQMRNLSQALDYSLVSVTKLRTSFQDYENEYFSSSRKNLILINILIIFIAQIIVFFYWYINLRRLRKKLIRSRTIFIHIPFPILMRQKLIKKYLWDTNLNQI